MKKLQRLVAYLPTEKQQRAWANQVDQEMLQIYEGLKRRQPKAAPRITRGLHLAPGRVS